MIDINTIARDCDQAWDKFDGIKKLTKCFSSTKGLTGKVSLSNETEFWNSFNFRQPSFVDRIDIPYPPEIQRIAKPPHGAWKLARGEPRHLAGPVFCWEDSCIVVDNTSVESGPSASTMPETRYFKYDCPLYPEISDRAIPLLDDFSRQVATCLDTITGEKNRITTMTDPKKRRSLTGSLDGKGSSMYMTSIRIKSAIASIREGKLDEWGRDAKASYTQEVMGDSSSSVDASTGIRRAINAVERAIAGNEPKKVDIQAECKVG
jgi:hypothetical protein